MNEKDDNIDCDDSSYSSSVDTYVLESEMTDRNTHYSKKYFSISNNLKMEYGMIQKLRLTLDTLNAISVSDIETLLDYTKEIDDLMKILADIHHTIKALQEFEKTFKLKEVNGGIFVIKVMKKTRRRKKVKRKYTLQQKIF
jgi:hypothetical protein